MPPSDLATPPSTDVPLALGWSIADLFAKAPAPLPVPANDTDPGRPEPPGGLGSFATPRAGRRRAGFRAEAGPARRCG